MRYKSGHQAVGYMIRYLEKRRSPRCAILDPNVLRGKVAGEDYDADALTVLILFCRFDGKRNSLTKLYIHRVRFREIKNNRDRSVASHANRRFLKQLCCRGLLAFQGGRNEPHRSCRAFQAGECYRFAKSAEE